MGGTTAPIIEAERVFLGRGAIVLPLWGGGDAFGAPHLVHAEGRVVGSLAQVLWGVNANPQGSTDSNVATCPISLPPYSYQTVEGALPCYVPEESKMVVHQQPHQSPPWGNPGYGGTHHPAMVSPSFHPAIPCTANPVSPRRHHPPVLETAHLARPLVRCTSPATGFTEKELYSHHAFAERTLHGGGNRNRSKKKMVVPNATTVPTSISYPPTASANNVDTVSAYAPSPTKKSSSATAASPSNQTVSTSSYNSTS